MVMATPEPCLSTGRMGPACEDCGRYPHVFSYHFTLRVASVTQSCTAVVGERRAKSLRKVHFFLAKGTGKREPWEPENVEKIPERKELEKGSPLILCLNEPKSWAHPQAVHKQHSPKRSGVNSLRTEL